MDEQNNQYQLLEKDESDKDVTPDEPLEQETDVTVKKIKVKKKKKKKEKEMSQQSSDAMTKFVLIAILFVGICLLCISLFGIFTALGDVSNSNATAENATASNNQANSVITNTETTTLNTNVIVNADTENNDNNTNDSVDGNVDENSADASATAPQSDAEWLAFFSNAVNKLKTDGPSFSKSKRTQTADIQLSNPLAQAYVSVAKDKYLSDETVVTDVAKGDTANAVAVVSPDGEAYVSKLSMSDIKSISHTTNADGNYEITINMPDATNPDLSSAYGRIFEFMLIDDVMDTYAPNMGATVDRENVSLLYSECYAKAVITPDGKLVKYDTRVNADMILKSAKISVVTTDLDVILYSDTSYTNIVW